MWGLRSRPLGCSHATDERSEDDQDSSEPRQQHSGASDVWGPGRLRGRGASLDRERCRVGHPLEALQSRAGSPAHDINTLNSPPSNRENVRAVICCALRAEVYPREPRCS